MLGSEGDLQHWPREEQPLWDHAVGVAPPGVEETPLPSIIIFRAGGEKHIDVSAKRRRKEELGPVLNKSKSDPKRNWRCVGGCSSSFSNNSCFVG